MPILQINTHDELSGLKMFFQHSRDGFDEFDENENSSKANNCLNILSEDIDIFTDRTPPWTVELPEHDTNFIDKAYQTAEWWMIEANDAPLSEQGDVQKAHRLLKSLYS